MPVPEPVLATTPDPALQHQLNALVAQARSGDASFRGAVASAEAAAAAAGAPESESWIAAQQALSAIIALRAPVTRAAADIDALGATRVQRLGGLAAADLEAINDASAAVRELDSSEAALIGRLQARLAR